MKLHIFNPENDLALADGNANYCAPPSACKIAYDLATLPLWYANSDDYVNLSDAIHIEYHKEYSPIFFLPQIYSQDNINDITSISPWGWSRQIARRIENMGFANEIILSSNEIEKLRELSNRKVTIKILDKLSKEGVDIPQLPQYISNAEEVGRYICSMPLSVIKAPWSGSGKGIAWGLGRMEIPVEHFYKGVIRRQGGVVCEPFLNKKVDFAMEFYLNEGKISFEGYSLFKSNKGVYSGNILATDNDIESFINSYNPKTSLLEIKNKIIPILENLFSSFKYSGYFGIDMMLYQNDDGEYHINPCVELNLRMNMGMTSHIFFNKYVKEGRRGIFNIEFYKQKGIAKEYHNERKIKYPLTCNFGKIVSGYVSLNPVSEETQYSAYALIYEERDQNSLSSLYNL